MVCTELKKKQIPAGVSVVKVLVKHVIILMTAIVKAS